MISRLRRSVAVLWISVVISCLAAPDSPIPETFRRTRDPILQFNNTVDFDSPSANLERNPFLQWISGIFGSTTTTEKPVVQTPPQHCEPCECGIVNTKNRIVGGQETQVNQYPWMALLLYSGRFYCGATLINDRYVLTAAHCVSGFSPDRMSVRLIEHDRSTDQELPSITKKVARVVRHAGYSSSTYNNDIALVQLDSPVKYSSLLRPACMPTQGKSFSGFKGTVTGWGATQEHGSISENLQEVTVPIMSNKDCRQSGYGVIRITDNMLCAGISEGGRDSCQGDSGGPLHVNMDGAMQVVGVVSWGEGCAKPNYPGVYTRVNRYGTWIRSNTKDACYCSST